MKARRFLAVVLAVSLLLLGLGVGAWWLVWQRSPLQLQHRRLELPRAARFVPRDAALSLYLLSDADAPVAYARAVAPAAQRRPAGEALARLRDGAFAAAGLDYAGELADWLGPDSALTLLADGQDDSPAGWVLALPSRDGDGARRFLQRFWQMRSLAGTELQISSYRGMGLISGRGALRGQQPLPLATALIDDDLVLLASGRGVLEQALDVSQIDELNQAADAPLAERLGRLGEGVALLTGRVEALQAWLGQPMAGGGALVAALRPEGRELVLDGWLQHSGPQQPLPSLKASGAGALSLLEAVHGEAASIALLQDPAHWPEAWRQRLLQLQPGVPADQALPALLLQQAEGPLLWREGAAGRLLGSAPAGPDPADLASLVEQQGLVAAPLELEGEPVQVWTRLQAARGGAGLEATLIAARGMDDGWAWWSDSLEVLSRQRRGHGQPRALLDRLGDLAMPDAALRWAGEAEPSRALLQRWAGWRRLSALAGQPLGPSVRALALAVQPEPLAPASGQAASPELRLRLRLAFAA